jgi:hypothetical protein
MHYSVTYLAGVTEHTEEIEAPDAATAVSKVQFEHGRTDEHFELISVQLLDPQDLQIAIEPADEPK